MLGPLLALFYLLSTANGDTARGVWLGPCDELNATASVKQLQACLVGEYSSYNRLIAPAFGSNRSQVLVFMAPTNLVEVNEEMQTFKMALSLALVRKI